MKVILNSDVQNLGEEGDIVDVKPGYARNFLLPRKLVQLYSTQAVALLESRRAAIEKRKEEKRKSALSDKEKLGQITLSVKMAAGEGGRLFGAVTSTTIAEELAKQGFSIERKKIEIPGHTIKHTGDFKINVRLYGNEIAELKLQIRAIEEKPAVKTGKPEHTRAEAPAKPAEEAADKAANEAAE